MKCVKRLFDLNLTRFELFMIFCVYGSSVILRASSLHFPTFANITPEWRCGAGTSFSRNCTILQECGENATFRSPFYSARQEFGLVCDRAYLAAMVSSLQYVGVLLGANVFGQLSDAYGRRWITIVVSCGDGLFSLASSFAPGYVSLTVLRFLTGFFSGGGLVAITVYLVESVKPQQRIFMYTFVSWPVIMCIITLIAYVTNSWRWFLRVSSMIGVFTPLIIFFVAPESLKWATDQNNLELAEEIADKIERINGGKAVPAKEKELRALEKTAKQAASLDGATSNGPKVKGRSYAIKDLIATRQMVTLTASMCVLWPTIALTSYTISFDSRNLEGNFYVNQLLIASFILASNALLFVVDTYVPKFNRRAMHQGPQLMVALLAATIAVLLAIGLEGRARLAVTILAVSSTFFASFVWDAVYLCTAELFPTEVRATAFGVCNFFARAAVILAPQAVLLREKWEPGPYVIISCVGFIAFGISYKFLPDTKNRELPSSVKEAMAFKH